MRRSLSIIFVLGLALTAAAQTSSNPPISAYAGRWQASFQGKPFIVVNLRLDGGQFVGTVTHTRDIHVNGRGELDKVVGEMSKERILETKLTAGSLQMIGQDIDSEESNGYEMRLTGKNEATLKFLVRDAPANAPKIQPWKVTRVAAK